MKSGVKPPKQTVFIAKSTKKLFWLANSGVTSSIFGVSGLELHSSSIEPFNFIGAQAVIWGKTPRNAPRGAGPDCPGSLSEKYGKPTTPDDYYKPEIK